MAFSAACQRHMMVQHCCCDSGSTNKLCCKCSMPINHSKCEATLDDFGQGVVLNQLQVGCHTVSGTKQQ